MPKEKLTLETLIRLQRTYDEVTALLSDPDAAENIRTLGEQFQTSLRKAMALDANS